METATENEKMRLAHDVVSYTDTHIFLTGKAGTGKTTFLRRLRMESPKRMVVLAPTGIAAINAGGVTIHSFFQLPFAPYIPGGNYASYKANKQKIDIIKSLDLVVIDEISMVRADLLDAVDANLRRYRRNNKPFGGVQLLMIGDLQQLAPVVKEDEWRMLSDYYDTPFFFSSQALRQTNYVTVELNHVYRQSDTVFLDLLNKVRTGTADSKALRALNSRYIAGFKPPKSEGYIQLVTHNHQARSINESELAQLPDRSFSYSAEVKGKFPELSYPTDEHLTLKLGAQIMFVKNDKYKQYFNGMIGEIVEIDGKGFRVCPKDEPSLIIDVQPDEWANTRYGLNEKTKEIEEIVEGTFVQFPVKLAWAITIHKSQGLTFDKVMVDASGAFAHGQTYVALSRCRTLEGIVLTSQIPEKAIIADANVEHFNDEMLTKQVTGERMQSMRQEYGLHLLSDLFAFDNERRSLASIVRIFQEHLYKIYPDTMRQYEATAAAFENDVVAVAARFHNQYRALLQQASGDFADAKLQERVTKGASYFATKAADLLKIVEHTQLEVDNKEVAKRLHTSLEELTEALSTHCALLNLVAEKGFSVKEYLNERAKILLGDSVGEKASKPAKVVKEKAYEVPSEIKNAELYTRLVAWRKRIAEDEGVPPTKIVKASSMIALSTYAPTSMSELRRIPRLGKKTIDEYGGEILSITANYNSDVEAGVVTPKTRSIKAIPSHEQSLELYKGGKSVEEIAKERGFATSTIVGHLLQYVNTGEVDINDLAKPENLAKIKAYFTEHPYDKEPRHMGEIRDIIGGDITYGDLKVAMMLLGYDQLQRFGTKSE